MSVRDHAAGLQRSVPAVFGQTWQGPLRLLVVENGATEQTRQVLASLARTYGRVEVVRHRQARGREAAAGTVVSRAGGDYLAWIEPGDLWHPRRLELQIDTLRERERAHPGVPLLCTGTFREVFPDRGEVEIITPELADDRQVPAPATTLPADLSCLVGRAESFRDGARRLVGAPPRVVLFTRVTSGAPRPGGAARPGPVRRRDPASRSLTPAARRLLPRRSRVVEMAHRTGLRRLLAGTRIGRRLEDGIRARLAEPGAAGPRPALRRGELPAAVVALEAEVSAPGAGANPQRWLALADAYRSSGLWHSAESALRRGLQVHPDASRLRVRLVELLSVRRDWAQCVDRWAGLDRTDLRVATGLTYARVAHAFRALARPTEALAVARDGVRRWPRDDRVRREVHLNRAALVDWARAVSSAPVPAGDDGEQVGVVTDLGFLVGGDGPVEGWLTPLAGRAPEVSLSVNGYPVATTSAAASPRAGGDRLRFSLSCHDLLPYLGDGDTVAVTCAGRPLAIEGYRAPVVVTTGYRSRVAELRAELAVGYVFTKFGAFRAGNTARRKAQTLALYREVATILGDAYGYRVFPFYGNLLGAVREHDFISHDVGGFDLGYVSSHQRAEDVRAEFADICRLLLDRGYHLTVEPWSAYVRTLPDSPVFVDLNYAWFTAAGELHLSFGWRYPPVTDRDRVLAPREAVLGTQLVPVPGNAEQVLAQIYGPTWAVPDQGFALAAGLTRDPAFLLTAGELAQLAELDPDRVRVVSDHRAAAAPDEPDTG